MLMVSVIILSRQIYTIDDCGTMLMAITDIQ